MNKEKILEMLSSIDCNQDVRDKLATQIDKEYQLSIENIAKSTEQEKIDNHFGKKQNIENITTWGSANLPENIYQAMSASCDGMKIMEQLMQNNTGNANTESSSAYYDANENALIDMVYQDSYWNNQNNIVDKVHDGFKNIYQS